MSMVTSAIAKFIKLQMILKAEQDALVLIFQFGHYTRTKSGTINYFSFSLVIQTK